MNGVPTGWSVIPKGAWWTAIAVTLILGPLLAFCVPHDPEMPPAIRLLLIFIAAPLMGALVLLYGYVYGDARRRGMRPILWLLLAIFIPNLIGVILFFVLRDPLPWPCRQCGEVLRKGFTYCPSCGAQAAPACPQCSRAIERGWSNCPYCGAKIATPAN